MSKKLTYPDLLETNNLLQNHGEETYWLCVTRTVQESKLFPVSAYILLSYINAFYRWPTLLRKIEKHMPAERIADRVRNVSAKIETIGSAWCLPNFYLLGREHMINLGMIRPQDGIEDVAYVLDFWKRYSLSWRRNEGHITAREAGHRSQIYPERKLQVFHADMYDCEAGDALHTAAGKFMAATAQYGFLVSCESRVSMTAHGPYKISDNVEMLVRNFYDLSQSDYPWLDGVADDVPYNCLTVTTAVKDTHFYLVDDWGSFEAKPEYKSENICGVGLYTSDPLTDTHVPVGMGSREELTQTFETLAEKMREANTRLWTRLAGYSRDQLLDCGALVYYSIIKDMAHFAGCYEIDDWMKIDERANRFRGLLNDEYANEVLGAMLVPLTLPSSQSQDYFMMVHGQQARHVYTPFSYSLLGEKDYVGSVGGLHPGTSTLPDKVDRYRTSQGFMSNSDFNTRVRDFTPPLVSEKFRDLDETWVKYHYDTALADELYKLEQTHSRNLKGRGAGLRRSDIEALRAGG